MTNEEYAGIRLKLGLDVKSWTELLGISLSSHKKFNAGITPISKPIEKHLKTQLKLLDTVRILNQYRHIKD